MTTPKTLVLLHLDEAIDEFHEHDAAGGLADLTASGFAAPAVVDALCGKGREFDGAATGLSAGDAAGADTVTTRDATVQILLALGSLSSAPWALYYRGANSGDPAEYVNLGIDLEKLASPPNHFAATLVWNDAAGVEKRQPSGVFVYDTVGEFVLLTATRRWVSSTEVVCRYYLGDRLLDEVTSADGDIAGDTLATTVLGVRGDGAAGWERFFEGILDEVKVTNYEMSAEEVRASWARMTTYADRGARTLALHMPPGSRWGEDGTNWGRMTKIAGRGLGMAWAKSDELRDNFLPDRAYQGIDNENDIGRWERLFGIAPGGHDSLDQRRARVVEEVARINGYSREQVADYVARALDLTADQVEILEFPNQWRDEFATAIDAIRWTAVQTWTHSGSSAAAAIGGGGDARYSTPNFNRFRLETPLESARGRMVVETVVAYALPASTMAGLSLLARGERTGLWFGVYHTGGVDKVGYFLVTDGVAAAFVEMDATAPALFCYLRATRDPTGRDAVDSAATVWRLEWSADGVTWDHADITIAAFEPTTAGPSVFSTATWAAGAYQALFDYWYQDTPQGRVPFCWYVWRDVGTYGAGNPDVGLARALVRAVKPAETHGSAITSRALLCGDPVDGCCDAGPLGGL
jgi:hypothetical protein